MLRLFFLGVCEKKHKKYFSLKTLFSASAVIFQNSSSKNPLLFFPHRAIRRSAFRLHFSAPLRFASKRLRRGYYP